MTGTIQRRGKGMERMRIKIAIGLILVFAGTSNISWGIVLGVYHLHVFGTLGLITVTLLSAFGALLLWLGKTLAAYPEYDLGPQICLLAFLGVVIGAATTCCDILLPRYGQICGLGKYFLGVIIGLCIAMFVCRFESVDPTPDDG